MAQAITARSVTMHDLPDRERLPDNSSAEAVSGAEEFSDSAHRAALKSEICYQGEVLRCVSEAVVATDRELRIRAWNAAAERVFGFAAVEVLGRQVTEFVQSALFVNANRADEVFFGEGPIAAEEVLYHRNGRAMRIRLSIAPIRASHSSAEPGLGGMVVTLNDVTRRRRAEDEYRTVVAALQEGVLHVDADATIRAANSAAMRLLADGELRGRDAFSIPVDIFDERGEPLDDALNPLALTLADAEARADTVVGIRRKPRKPGIDSAGTPQITWLLVNCMPVFAADRLDSVVMSFTDITERREIERMKDEFVSVVSHELRTPLTSIRGALDYLSRRGFTGGVAGIAEAGGLEAGREMLRIAESNADRLMRIVGDLLDIKTVEAGARMRAETVDPEGLVAAAVAQLGGFSHASEIELATTVGDGVERLEIQGDRVRLLQVLTNLMSNAISHAPRGTAVQVGVNVSGEGHLRFQVEDEGPGVPADKQDLLFEKFSQLDSSDRRAHPGAGLGLAIAKGIVRQHGGEIGLCDTCGDGAAFFFELPAQQRANGAESV